MYIPGIQQDKFIPKRNNSAYRNMHVESTADKHQDKNRERRRRPDRRQMQHPIKIADRRQKRDRRQPKLLNPNTATPEKISSPKGRTIDTKA